MNSKVWIRQAIIAAAFIVALFAIYGDAQTTTSRTNSIFRPCTGSTTPASVQVRTVGDIYLTPCSAKTVYFSGTGGLNIGSNNIVGDLAARYLQLSSAGTILYFNATNYLYVVGSDMQLVANNAPLRWDGTQFYPRTTPANLGLVTERWGASFLGNVSLTVTTPAQITANQNDYALPAGGIARVSSDAARDVTGLVAGSDGRTIAIVNVGAQTVTLKHQNAGSAAANRFLNSTAADIVLSADQAADCLYDGTTLRWRCYKRN